MSAKHRLTIANLFADATPSMRPDYHRMRVWSERVASYGIQRDVDDTLRRLGLASDAAAKCGHAAMSLDDDHTLAEHMVGVLSAHGMLHAMYDLAVTNAVILHDPWTLNALGVQSERGRYGAPNWWKDANGHYHPNRAPESKGDPTRYHPELRELVGVLESEGVVNYWWFWLEGHAEYDPAWARYCNDYPDVAGMEMRGQKVPPPPSTPLLNRVGSWNPAMAKAAHPIPAAALMRLRGRHGAWVVEAPDPESTARSLLGRALALEVQADGKAMAANGRPMPRWLGDRREEQRIVGEYALGVAVRAELADAVKECVVRYCEHVPTARRLREAMGVRSDGSTPPVPMPSRSVLLIEENADMLAKLRPSVTPTAETIP